MKYLCLRKENPKNDVYDNKGYGRYSFKTWRAPGFFPIFLREFYLQGVFSVVENRVSSLKSLERRLHGWKKRMPSLKWSHGVKRHHFVFSLVPSFCCCKHGFQCPWYNCQFFCSRFGYYKSHKDFSCAQLPVADSPLTRSWWINVEKSPRKIFWNEKQHLEDLNRTNQRSAVPRSFFFSDEIIQR